MKTAAKSELTVIYIRLFFNNLIHTLAGFQTYESHLQFVQRFIYVCIVLCTLTAVSASRRNCRPIKDLEAGLRMLESSLHKVHYNHEKQPQKWRQVWMRLMDLYRLLKVHLQK